MRVKKPKKPEKSARENEILRVKKTKNRQKKAFTPTFSYHAQKKKHWPGVGLENSRGHGVLRYPGGLSKSRYGQWGSGEIPDPKAEFCENIIFLHPKRRILEVF